MRNASIDSPIDDLTYDVLTVLHAKAKALEAYDKYIDDAADDEEAREAFEAIKRQDQEHVRVLKEVLARRLDEDLGYGDEEEDEDYDEDEDEIADEEELEAGDGRGEARSAGAASPPRRGESASRR